MCVIFCENLLYFENDFRNANKDVRQPLKPYDVLRLRLDIVNDSACPAAASRETALRTSLITAHTLLAVSAGGFLSATDPPALYQSHGKQQEQHSKQRLFGYRYMKAPAFRSNRHCYK